MMCSLNLTNCGNVLTSMGKPAGNQRIIDVLHSLMLVGSSETTREALVMCFLSLLGIAYDSRDNIVRPNTRVFAYT